MLEASGKQRVFCSDFLVTDVFVRSPRKLYTVMLCLVGPAKAGISLIQTNFGPQTFFQVISESSETSERTEYFQAEID